MSHSSISTSAVSPTSGIRECHDASAQLGDRTREKEVVSGAMLTWFRAVFDYEGYSLTGGLLAMYAWRS